MKHAILAAASLAFFSAGAFASGVNDRGKLLLEQDFGTLRQSREGHQLLPVQTARSVTRP